MQVLRLAWGIFLLKFFQKSIDTPLNEWYTIDTVKEEDKKKPERKLIMKKYTAKEIAKYIDETGTLLEIENDGNRTTFKYYLHYKDGELVRSADGADFTTFVDDEFLTNLWDQILFEELEDLEKDEFGEYDFDEYQEAQNRATDRFDGPDGAWSIETVDSKQLLEVAQSLADELNAYIEEYED